MADQDQNDMDKTPGKDGEQDDQVAPVEPEIVDKPAATGVENERAEKYGKLGTGKSDGTIGLVLTGVAVLGIAALFVSMVSGQRYQNQQQASAESGEEAARTGALSAMPATEDAGADAAGDAGAPADTETVTLDMGGRERPALEPEAAKILNSANDRARMAAAETTPDEAGASDELPTSETSEAETGNAIASAAKEARTAISEDEASGTEPETTTSDEAVEINQAADPAAGDPSATDASEADALEPEATEAGAGDAGPETDNAAADDAADVEGAEPAPGDPANSAAPETVEAGAETSADDAPASDDAAAAASAAASALAQEIQLLRDAFERQADEFGKALAQERQDTERQAEQIARLQTTFQEDLAARLEQTAAQIAELQAKLDGANAASSAAAERTGKTAAAALALTTLAKSVDSGAPYANELSVLSRLAPDLEAIGNLRNMAATGAPTMTQLRDGFDPFARAAIAAASRETADGPLSTLKANIDELVSVRPSEYTEGDTPAAIISRAEDSLRKGDLNKATVYLGELEGAAAAAFEPWIADARARLDVDGAIASLNETLLGALNQ
ncbi:MAG: hypothetical protein GC152_01270 [Alphaproteobacteria bacterium]|nr:hypothetical protein [Alphaproteobacteria bacterium]